MSIVMHPDFNRDVHCLLGLPFDAVDLQFTLQRIRAAADSRSPCFLSTPNLNFLIASQSDTIFRRSVINSDLSIADGMPIVWISHLLGIPIRERVAGSDVFERLKTDSTKKLSVYFFGGMEGVAEKACKRLNAEQSGMTCSGFESPGFGTIIEMSDTKSLEKINASGADFLIVSLGAKKGQAWIEKNRMQLTIPVISHLGAVINFTAGGLERAPTWIQRSGFEWLWRIKEEPGLWKRYASDGVAFLKLLVTRIIPYAWLIYRKKPKVYEFASSVIELRENETEIVIHLHGAWIHNNLSPIRECFSIQALSGRDIQLDLEYVTYIDSAFIGILLLLYRAQIYQDKKLLIFNPNKMIRKIFRYSCVEFLY